MEDEPVSPSIDLLIDNAPSHRIIEDSTDATFADQMQILRF